MACLMTEMTEKSIAKCTHTESFEERLIAHPSQRVSETHDNALEAFDVPKIATDRGKVIWRFSEQDLESGEVELIIQATRRDNVAGNCHIKEELPRKPVPREHGLNYNFNLVANIRARRTYRLVGMICDLANPSSLVAIRQGSTWLYPGRQPGFELS
jgi:hypothetical protein